VIGCIKVEEEDVLRKKDQNSKIYDHLISTEIEGNQNRYIRRSV
jgi:hypothetical protein